jgi:hypothetical protein
MAYDPYSYGHYPRMTGARRRRIGGRVTRWHLFGLMIGGILASLFSLWFWR